MLIYSYHCSDVVKTKMQTEPEKYTSSVLQATKDIIASEGVFFLLAGLGLLHSF